MDAEHTPLNEFVLEARDQRFGEVLAAQRDRVRSRRSRRGVLGAVTLLVVAAIIGSLRQPESMRRKPAYEIIERSGPPSFAVVESSAAVAQSGSDPETKRNGVVEYVDDEAMLAELRAAGFDVGWAKIGDRVLFVSR